MLITDKLVVLNFPKTGSSFIRKVLKKIHHVDNFFGKHLLYKGLKINGIRELIMPSNQSVYQYKNKEKGQHSTYSQIPDKYRNKSVVTAIRNPFERYVSLYEYRWYAKNNFYRNNREVLSKYPHFPNISFEEYLDITFNIGIKQFFEESLEGLKIGAYSLQFIRFFYQNPDTLIRKLINKEIDIEDLKEKLPDINFLKTEDLSNELYRFLVNVGYDEEKVQFIQKEKKVNWNKSNWQHNKWEEYYDQKLIEKILTFDELIFSLFPQYKNTI